MTDLPTNLHAVPGRLGATALVDERGLVIELEPQEEELHLGVLRISVITFIVDVVAGVTLDTDPDAWTFTTDLTLRMRPIPAPAKVSAFGSILRHGRRSAHTVLEVIDEQGGEVAVGAIGFAHVPRKPDDPRKPIVSREDIAARFSADDRIARPLREEAEIVSIDPAAGVVEMEVRPEVCNPAGTIQGAMVALVAEAATEDLMASMGAPAVVTELDLRYLGQTTVGPVRSRCRVLGEGPCPPVQVELVDLSTDRVTTLAYTRGARRRRLIAVVSRFDRDTAVTPTGDGSYAARIDPGWWIERGPNGGYVAAVLVQALTAEVAEPMRHLRSLTIHYLAPAREGAADVTVQTERSGRTISFLDARLQQADRLLATARAAFAVQSSEGPAFADPTFPGYPPPDTLAVRDDPPGMVAMRDRYEYHHVVGLPWEGPSDQAETGGWIRLREPRPYDAAVVAALSDAWYPAIFTRLASPMGVPTIDLTVHVRSVDALQRMRPDDFMAVRFRTTMVAEGYLEEDGELWAPDGTLVAHSRQLGLILTR